MIEIKTDLTAIIKLYIAEQGCTEYRADKIATEIIQYLEQVNYSAKKPIINKSAIK